MVVRSKPQELLKPTKPPVVSNKNVGLPVCIVVPCYSQGPLFGGEITQIVQENTTIYNELSPILWEMTADVGGPCYPLEGTKLGWSGPHGFTRCQSFAEILPAATSLAAFTRATARGQLAEKDQQAKTSERNWQWRTVPSVERRVPKPFIFTVWPVISNQIVVFGEAEKTMF